MLSYLDFEVDQKIVEYDINYFQMTVLTLNSVAVVEHAGLGVTLKVVEGQNLVLLWKGGRERGGEGEKRGSQIRGRGEEYFYIMMLVSNSVLDTRLFFNK